MTHLLYEGIVILHNHQSGHFLCKIKKICFTLTVHILPGKYTILI